jgi:hypothetical protein
MAYEALRDEFQVKRRRRMGGVVYDLFFPGDRLAVLLGQGETRAFVRGVTRYLHVAEGTDPADVERSIRVFLTERSRR